MTWGLGGDIMAISAAPMMAGERAYFAKTILSYERVGKSWTIWFNTSIVDGKVIGKTRVIQAHISKSRLSARQARDEK
jgi:hypothetical protein